MIASAKARYVRISPFKVRRLLGLVKNKRVLDALDMLSVMPHKGAKILYKVIYSALSNARQQASVPEEDLYISKIYVDGAGFLKRWRPEARGRVKMIRHRLSHITVELDAKSTLKETGGA